MAKKKVDLKENSSEDEINTGVKYELKDLPGVGEVTIKKLKDAGIISIKYLAIYPIAKLMDKAGIGEKTAKKIVKAAQDIEKMGFKSADVIWEKRKHLNRLTTSSHTLDELFAGGIEPGALTEFYGEYRTGKTQIAHQS